jgi:hypothetical protein
LPQFIEELYFKRFGKTAPDTVLFVEERSRLKKEAGRTAEQRAVDNATTRDALLRGRGTPASLSARGISRAGE